MNPPRVILDSVRSRTFRPIFGLILSVLGSSRRDHRPGVDCADPTATHPSELRSRSARPPGAQRNADSVHRVHRARRRSVPAFSAVAGLLAAGIGLSLAGTLSACSTARPHAPARASAAAEALHARAEVQTEGRVVVRADWDDVLASVNLAAGRVEMAVVRAPTASEVEHATELRFELLTATDEPATLIASRESLSSSANAASGSVDTPASSLAKTSPTGPTPITLTAHVGRFGDPTRERQLTAAVARRLEQLAGVEVAPGR